MKYKKIFGFIALILLFACLGIYIFLESKLTAAMPEPADYIDILAGSIAVGLLIAGLYHLSLLAHVLKTLSGKVTHSIFVAAIILSGISLLSDVTLLLEIDKEYLLFDVTLEWIMLYGFTAVHILVVILGLVYTSKYPAGDKKLFQLENDNLFMSMHHIALIAGILGVAGIVVAMTGTIVPDRFSVQFMILLASLALCPLILIVCFWMIKKRILTQTRWMDEKQVSDSAIGALASLLIGVLFYLIVILFDMFAPLPLPVPFWILFIFFVQLSVFSSVVLIKNG